MPAISRLGDFSTGHGCFPPKRSIQASSDVFANFIPVHRQNDAWEVHCCGSSCHGSSLAAGSPTVFSNFKEVSRIGDKITCGDVVATGSPNIFVGNSGGFNGGDTGKLDQDLVAHRTRGTGADEVKLSGPDSIAIGEEATFSIDNFDPLVQYIAIVENGTIKNNLGEFVNEIQLSSSILNVKASALGDTLMRISIQSVREPTIWDSFSVGVDNSFIGAAGEVMGKMVVLPNGAFAFLGREYRAILGMDYDISLSDGRTAFLKGGKLLDAFGREIGEIVNHTNADPNLDGWFLQISNLAAIPLTELYGTYGEEKKENNFASKFSYDDSETPFASTENGFGTKYSPDNLVYLEKNDTIDDYFVHSSADYDGNYREDKRESKYFYKLIKKGNSTFLAGYNQQSNVNFSGGDVWSGYRQGRKTTRPGGSLTVEFGEINNTRVDVFEIPITLWTIDIVLPEDIISLCYAMVEITPILRGDLTGHVFLWEQISGDDTTITWLTPKDQPIAIIDFGGLKVDRVFRFWADKGTTYQKYKDITIYGTPIEKPYSLQTAKFSKNRPNLNSFVYETSPYVLSKQNLIGAEIYIGK